MRNRICMTAFAVAVVIAVVPARADIFQWEYINPADPSQGKRQSTTLAPDGAGVDAMPYAVLAHRNLTMAYLIGADLTGANAVLANLTHADLSRASLSNVEFHSANLTGTNFPEANLTNARFGAADLTGANFRRANLANADFMGESSVLCEAYFCPPFPATLTDADFTDADVRGAKLGYTGITLAQLYSTASYQAHDLSGISLMYNNLTGANFVGQNLSNASFLIATLTNADFTVAEIRGANFARSPLCNSSFVCFISPGGTGITLAQLYTTASYEAHDLTGVQLDWHDLRGANFAGQNLTNVSFYAATLTDADFTDAQIRGADFRGVSTYFFPYRVYGTGITLAQLYSTASYQEGDVRGVSGLDLSNAITTNLILPDGHARGLDLDANALIVIRDYDGNPNSFPGNVPIPITVEQHLVMSPSGTLRLVFDADPWNSTISFAPGIPVALGGTLELTFADDVNLVNHVGRTFDLFDWTGVNPTGAFAISSPYAWDTSNLYTTGQVTLTAVPEPGTLALAAIAMSVFMLRQQQCQYKV